MSHQVGLPESIWNTAKKLGFLVVAVTLAFLVATASLSSAAFAQQAQSSYNYGYFVNAHTAGFADADMYIVNPGSTGGTSPSGDLCANIYVFNPAQQMVECCSCKVTPDSLTTFSVNTNVTDNPFTAATVHTGAIKIVSSAVPASGSCNNVGSTSYAPSGYLGTWITHVHVASGTYSKSETSFLPGTLSVNAAASGTELPQLQKICGFIETSGTGFGICTCPSE